MKQPHPVKSANLDRFYHLNNAMREATAQAEVDFFAQLKDLNVLQANIILSINFHQPCKMSQIAKRAQLTQGSVTQTIDKLESKGYVKRVRSKEDRRVVYVELTAKGNKVVAANETYVKQVAKDVLQKFTEKEQVQFLDFFARMGE